MAVVSIKEKKIWVDEMPIPLNLLGFQEPLGIISGAPGKANLKLFGRYDVESAWWHTYDDSAGDPITVERLPYRNQPSEELVLQFSLQEGLRYTIGYQIKRGEGWVMVIGLQPSPGLLLALHDHFDVTIPSRSKTVGVSSALFQRDDDYYLITTNDGEEAKAASFDLPAISGSKWMISNLPSDKTTNTNYEAQDAPTIIMPPKDGAVLRLSPAAKG